jgi:hypothetical protein
VKQFENDLEVTGSRVSTADNDVEDQNFYHKWLLESISAVGLSPFVSLAGAVLIGPSLSASILTPRSGQRAILPCQLQYFQSLCPQLGRIMSMRCAVRDREAHHSVARVSDHKGPTAMGVVLLHDFLFSAS